MSRHNRDRRKASGHPKYVASVVAASERALARGEMKPGSVYVVPVRHDAGCSLLRGTGACDCEPEVGAPERVPAPDEN